MALDAKWTATVDDGVTNDKWDAYDDTIKGEIDAYNSKLGTVPGFKKVDWKFGKAMLWVESGGPSSSAWLKKVMQIGNPGDKGYKVVKSGTEGSSLIMTTQLASDLKTKTIDDPALNIKAAMAYLFTRMAKFEEQTVMDSKDTKEYSHTVVPGDSLDRIAHKVGTTVDVLEKMNPSAVKMIHPKQVLKYKKASRKLVIVGCRDFTTANIADRYNGGGDSDYAAKLDYVLELFKKLKR